ncbi:uncharacterized protein LOC119719904 [Patiria miniata]|uniref:CARD domain-containing protein n=1 Tax=Patiria miniata TaxID=46514 RepID=A0A913Z050_PATMI|nr:uncharacterized protein LOC119719904 [Patiria miniata]
MDETDLYSLNAVSDYITENLDAKYISDQLIEKEVLDVDHDEEIQAEKTAKRRTERLLEILPNTRQDALKLFKEALEKDYPHIVKKLDEVQVPVQRTGTKPGKGGLCTAAAATSATATSATKVASSTDRGVTTTTATQNKITSRTTNIKGNNNMVIIGGCNTTINHYR